VVNLRDYQQECSDKAWVDLQQPAAKSLVVLPTGAGKTVVFSHFAQRWAGNIGRVLILAHRKELIDQAASKFERMTGIIPTIEMADFYAHTGLTKRVVVGSVDTMKGRRLERWPSDYFSLIIVDEAHRAIAPKYKRIYNHFDQARLLGVTATPDRGDKQNLGDLFQSVAYQMEILDAIRKGWLVNIKQRFVHVDSLDISKVHNDGKDDLDRLELDEVMRSEENIHKIARPIFDLAGNRHTLVFATSVAHSKAISDLLNSYRPGCSEYVASYRIKEDGGREDYDPELRKKEIEWFKSGRRQFLVNYGIFTEGFDAPNCSMIAMARLTKSRALYSQMLGRGTRPLDGIVDRLNTPEERAAAILASAKPDALILDFVGNSGRHKLVYADDILFPHAKQEDRERARLKSNNQERDVQEAMEESIEEAKQEVLKKEQAIEELRRKLGQRMVANFYMKDVDPFGGQAVTPEVRLKPVSDPPSEKQVNYLLVLAKQAGQRFEKRILMTMPRKQVQGIIGHLRKRLGVYA